MPRYDDSLRSFDRLSVFITGKMLQMMAVLFKKSRLLDMHTYCNIPKDRKDSTEGVGLQFQESLLV
jgi:hypothetical protein